MHTAPGTYKFKKKNENLFFGRFLQRNVHECTKLMQILALDDFERFAVVQDFSLLSFFSLFPKSTKMQQEQQKHDIKKHKKNI